MKEQWFISIYIKVFSRVPLTTSRGINIFMLMPYWSVWRNLGFTLKYTQTSKHAREVELDDECNASWLHLSRCSREFLWPLHLWSPAEVFGESPGFTPKFTQTSWSSRVQAENDESNMSISMNMHD